MKRPTFSLSPEELAETPQWYQREYLKHEEKMRQQKLNLPSDSSDIASNIQSYRKGVAIHEAAHLVAAAYTGAVILEVRICTEKGNDVINGRGDAKLAGYCLADHAIPVKNALIGLAGWAWDESPRVPWRPVGLSQATMAA